MACFWGNGLGLKHKKQKRNSCLYLPVSPNQYLQHPTDFARSQHILVLLKWGSTAYLRHCIFSCNVLIDEAACIWNLWTCFVQLFICIFQSFVLIATFITLFTFSAAQRLLKIFDDQIRWLKLHSFSFYKFNLKIYGRLSWRSLNQFNLM